MSASGWVIETGSIGTFVELGVEQRLGGGRDLGISERSHGQRT